MKNIYKMYLLVLFAISLLTQKTYSQFIQNMSLTGIDTNNLSCIHFVNDSIGFVGGLGGVILHTTDRGDSWTVKNPPLLSGKNITSIFFVNNDTGFVTTADVLSSPMNGTICRTDDAGLNWFCVKSDTIPLFSITFPSTDTGYAVGAKGKRFRTTDGGMNWFPIGNGIGVSVLYDVKFLDNTTGFLTHGTGRIYKTVNSGANWALIKDMAISAGPSNKIWFFDQTEGFWILNSKVYHTTDGGVNWTEKMDAILPLNDIYFVNSLIGFVAGLGGNVFRTVDGGLTWDHFVLELQSRAFPVIGGGYFKDEYHGIVVGDSGTVAKFAFADSVKGKVTNKDGDPVIDAGKVFLLHKRPIEVKMDTVAVYNLGVGGDYIFMNVPVGEYIVMAVPDSSMYLTTYHDTALFWQKAAIVNIFQSEAGIDIFLRDTFPPMTGTGTIQGQVREGNYFGGKVMTVGDPIKDINVALITNGNPVAIDMTDDSGRFEFTKVNTGTYKIHVEVPGIPVDSTNIFIGTNDTAIVNATVDSFQIALDTSTSTFINPIFVSEGLQIKGAYPNPLSDADGYLFIDVNNTGSKKYDISLRFYNLLGIETKLIENRNLQSGKNILKIKSSDIPDNITLLGIFVNSDSRSMPAYYSKIVKMK